MERAITGFRRDDRGDWVAELDCGHDQHVRHRPPFQQRPWVETERGRRERLGTPLACPLCDRAELPGALRLVRLSPDWDERTLPTGLRRTHRLAAGTWGRIVLREGRLRFTMAAIPPLEVELEGAGATQAIPPGVDHFVQPLGSVRLLIEFLAVDRQPGSNEGPSQPLDFTSGGDPACWAGLLCPECGAVLDGSSHRPGCPVASRLVPPDCA
jgi:tellurite methyltransferase